MKMKNKYINSIYEKVKNYCRTNYQHLDSNKFVLGQGLFNRKCHMNSVQRVKEGKASKVILTIIFTSNFDPMVHFINIDENGKYVDNTLGWEWECYNYYMIKELSEQEFDVVGGLLSDTKDFLVRVNSNKLLNKIFRIDEDIL